MDLIPNKKKLGITGIAPFQKIRAVDLSWDKLLRKGTILATALILVFLAVWVGFKIYESRADKKIKSLQAEQATIFSATDKLEAKKFLSIQESAVALQALLKSHIYASEFFGWLAKYTLPRVQWKSSNLDSSKGIVSLGGEASDYSTLAKQLLVFGEEEVGFKNIKLSGVALGKAGGVNFDLNFDFDSKKLQKQ